MNLAIALARVPRHLLVSEMAENVKTGARHEATGPKGVPIEIIRQAAVIYLIGQVTTPVTWVRIAQWVASKAGVSITTNGLRARVAHLLEGRVPGKNDERNRACAEYLIVCRAHGIRYPWAHIAQRVRAVMGVTKHPHRLSMDTVGWMKRQIEKAER